MENSANPTSTRRQLGKYHEMEAELVAGIKAAAAAAGLSVKALSERDGELLDDKVLWEQANRILQRTRVDPPTLSQAWVGRFKSRHGLRKDQLKTAVRRNTVSFTDDEESPPRKKPAPLLSRKQFTRADDVLLLQEAMRVQPWGFEQEMTGWLQIADNLNGNELLNLAVTSKSCQSRVQFMVTHLKAGDMSALLHNGTEADFVERLELINAVALQLDSVASAHLKGSPQLLDRSPTPASQSDLDGLREELESRIELLNREVGGQLHQLGHEKLRGELLETRSKLVKTLRGELLETLRGELVETLRGELLETLRGELLETLRGELLETLRGELLETLRGELLETMRGELQTLRGEQVETMKRLELDQQRTLKGQETMKKELQEKLEKLQQKAFAKIYDIEVDLALLHIAGVTVEMVGVLSQKKKAKASKTAMAKTTETK